MEEEKKKEKVPKRVFINDLDSYASRWIAKVNTRLNVGEEMEEEEVEEERLNQKAFEIVGTVCEGWEEDRSHILEEYCHCWCLYAKLSRDKLLPKLMECDVIIYNISQHQGQVEEAFWAVSALHSKMSTFTTPKMFILVSTVMTWACSKPVSPDDLGLPFNDDDFRRRRAHPNFKQHIDLEKRAVKMGKTNRSQFSTYVVASGLQYGMGEGILHMFFKMSWLGQAKEIPVFGAGGNIVPTIHINDLASVIHNVIEHQPRPYYLLAVDSSNNTMEEIMKAVADMLGPGKIKKKPLEEAFLQQDLSVMDIDTMLLDLRIESIHVKELFSVHWQCESGLVENIELVVEEYRQTRGLMPIRVVVVGPPAVGKTTVAKQMCEHYELHHIQLSDTISETISQLEETVKNPDPENEPAVTEAQELLTSLKESLEENGSYCQLDDQLAVRVISDKLASNPCQNQGFVLDGFPTTYQQAKELFCGETHTLTHTERNHTYTRCVCVAEFVFYLDATDDYLKERVLNLPERLILEQDYELDYFLEQLASFRDSNKDDDTVMTCFEELDCTPVCLEVTSRDEPDGRLLMEKIFDMVGWPRNYPPQQPGHAGGGEETNRGKDDERSPEESGGGAEGGGGGPPTGCDLGGLGSIYGGAATTGGGSAGGPVGPDEELPEGARHAHADSRPGGVLLSATRGPRGLPDGVFDKEQPLKLL
ncbi:unnamed protein product, partial [Lampetra planeri]